MAPWGCEVLSHPRHVNKPSAAGGRLARRPGVDPQPNVKVDGVVDGAEAGDRGS